MPPRRVSGEPAGEGRRGGGGARVGVGFPATVGVERDAGGDARGGRDAHRRRHRRARAQGGAGGRGRAAALAARHPLRTPNARRLPHPHVPGTPPPDPLLIPLLTPLWTPHPHVPGTTHRLLQRQLAQLVAGGVKSIYELLSWFNRPFSSCYTFYNNDTAAAWQASRHAAALGSPAQQATFATALRASRSRRRADAGYGPWVGGGTPSSGVVATTLLLGLCKSTSLYGFGEYKNHAEKAEYHYYNGMGALIKGNPVHSWPAEFALATQMGMEHLLALCQPKVRRR
eukprot:1189802-Prorocentrum_minimum.AAC.5